MRSIASLVVWFSLGVALVACQVPDPASAAPPATNAVPQTEIDKTLYTVGVLLGTQLEQFSLSESELGWVQRGIADQAMGHEVALNPDDYQTQVRQLHKERTAGQAAEPDASSVAFLEKQSAVDGAVVSESGLIMHEIVAGEGASPGAADTVLVHYHGTLQDGTVFDSSVDRGSPARFPLNRVIPCWTEGVGTMKVGGKSRLVCPPSIAYGARGAGKIPPNAPIVFEVELLEIE
jgi:FKBP-type peptidyl-prolyl cis-trans isomerase